MSVQLGVSGETLIPQSTSYGMLIGLGIGFCGVILAAVKIQKAYLAEDSGTSEMFMVANRSVGTGLTASAVFSSWMWINETVFSAAFCYKFGLAVPFWWSTGLCFQIALMAALGVLAKIRVPYAHTSLEIIRLRYGWIGHIVFIILNITNNVFGCAGMILTGSQLIYGISGMHFVAATILIPLGAVGGLKATFITDYLHTLIALILIIYFTLKVLTHDAVGGLGGLYDKVVATASENLIDGNYKGSLLTMKSRDAIIWGLILKFGNLALVVMDTAFWQKSFATEVNATVPGYNLAAVAIFGIPWGLGTVIGLTARALHNTPIWPGYPHEFTSAQVNAGLVMPYTIKALIGDQGIDAFLVLVFMALTSTVSSSMIAVSSILSFDVYKTYLNPKASDKKLVHVSHLTVVFHAVFITAISLALNYGGADMTWIGYFRPILSCPGIIPLGLTLCWSGQTRLAAIASPILGFLTGLGIWLGTAHVIYGEINMKTTEGSLPALYGAIGSFFSPALYSVLLSLYKPEKFDWRRFLVAEIAEETQLKESTEKEEAKNDGNTSSNSEGEPPVSSLFNTEKPGDAEKNTVTAAGEKLPPAVSSKDNALAGEVNLDDVCHPFDDDTIKLLYRWYRIAWYMFVAIVLVTFILWPMPLYRDYIFEKTFFKSWTTVAIIWQFFAFFAVVVYPLYDGRYEIVRGVKGVWHSNLSHNIAESRVMANLMMNNSSVDKASLEVGITALIDQAHIEVEKQSDADLVRDRRRQAINEYLESNVPEFAKLQTLRKKGWENAAGDTFFENQRNAADNADDRVCQFFFEVIKKVASEIHTATGAFDISRAGIGKGRILDMCMAPGGFLDVALDMNWKSRAIGFSLPHEDGGHKLRLQPTPYLDQRWMDITMLAADMGKAVIPSDHPDFSKFHTERQLTEDNIFDLAFCDGQVLRTQDRADYRDKNMSEARRLSCAQLALSLEHLRPGGTMIILLHKPEAWRTILQLRLFSKFSNIFAKKPRTSHKKRSSFYLIATNVQSKHPAAIGAIACWKKMWNDLTFGVDDNVADDSVGEEEPSVEEVLEDFGEHLVHLGRSVWHIQGQALEKAPFIQGK
ncbi:hypothetical protein COL516b_002732 [Colletotrichum fioriniae]|nr:uncharacterized protein COL516b_002732 [Colletotrichum fioriniae]KAJ0309487.1 hypothetical protein COL516b_002732 [Colletotrichum fioriniae]